MRLSPFPVCFLKVCSYPFSPTQDHTMLGPMGGQIPNIVKTFAELYGYKEAYILDLCAGTGLVGAEVSVRNAPFNEGLHASGFRLWCNHQSFEISKPLENLWNYYSCLRFNIARSFTMCVPFWLIYIMWQVGMAQKPLRFYTMTVHLVHPGLVTGHNQVHACTPWALKSKSNVAGICISQVTISQWKCTARWSVYVIMIVGSTASVLTLFCTSAHHSCLQHLFSQYSVR